MSARRASNPEAPLLRVKEVAALLNISETKVRGICARGDLRVVSIDKCVLIPRASFEAYLTRLLTPTPTLLPTTFTTLRGRKRMEQR